MKNKYVVRRPNGKLLAFDDGELIVYSNKEGAIRDAKDGKVEIYDTIIAHQRFGNINCETIMVEYNQAGCIYRGWVGGHPTGKGARLPSLVLDKSQFDALKRVIYSIF